MNISSIAGRIGFPVSTAYISSKFAIEGLSESLRYELGPFGVNVIIIEPGVIKTNFFDSMKIAEKANENDTYKEITDKSNFRSKDDGRNGYTAQKKSQM